MAPNKSSVMSSTLKDYYPTFGIMAIHYTYIYCLTIILNLVVVEALVASTNSLVCITESVATWRAILCIITMRLVHCCFQTIQCKQDITPDLKYTGIGQI